VAPIPLLDPVTKATVPSRRAVIRHALRDSLLALLTLTLSIPGPCGLCHRRHGDPVGVGRANRAAGGRRMRRGVLRRPKRCCRAAWPWIGLNARMHPFTAEDLRRLAGPKSFERGREYRESVMEVWRVRGGVAATVAGTHDYTVRLSHDGTELLGACTCPIGDDGRFCKHCVGLGLALLHGQSAAAAEDFDDRLLDGDREDDRLRAHLDALDRDTLAELLWEHAAEDAHLYRKLSLHAATPPPRSRGGRRTDRQAQGPDPSALDRQLTSQLRARGFIPYRGAATYARAAYELLGLIEELATGGQAAAEPLARRAVELITAALEQMDDSSGVAAGALDRAVVLHQQACRAAPPDPQGLASWLIRMVVEGPGWPDLRIEEYAEVLGERGLEAYRAELQALWKALPPAEQVRSHALPGFITESEARGSHHRWAVTHLMERLALRDGDVDAFVAVLSADLGSPWQYLRAATALREAGRDGEALAWAERGRNAFPDRDDPRLTSFLAAAYQQAGRHEDAIAVCRHTFTKRPTLETYQRLHSVAEPVGRWGAVRAQVLPLLDEHPFGGSVLVQILLWEGDVEAAWQAARTRPVLDEVLLELVERREVTHPADVIPSYERLAEGQIDRKNKTGYRNAAELIEHLRGLHDRLAEAGRFAAYLDQMRSRHKAKRNLMAELDRRGL
jgi:uncharacterized Zn finger protein